MNCDDCLNAEIINWEQDVRTGKAKPIYWCEKYKHLCSSINECQYYDTGE